MIGEMGEGTDLHFKSSLATDVMRLNRAYFEDGCACINTAKVIQICPTNMDDASAVAFYEKSCICSRNYIQR